MSYNGYYLGDGTLKQDTIEIDGLNNIYRELCECIGFENAIKIYTQYRGQQITFPVRLFSVNYVREQVIKRYNGKNIKELARDYGYSEKRIRTIIKESQSHNI